MSKNNGLLNYYPLAARFNKKLVLVVGGGKVAERKIQALSGSGARIVLISPLATPTLSRLAKQKKIRWIKRRVKKHDVEGAHVVIAATNDKYINLKVSRWAQQQRILVNVVDKPPLSTFISPAVFRLKKSIIAVYTDGKDPVFSRDLKNFLKEQWNDFLSYRNRL
ncbi:MAG: bifunctional precorrin-2 dehydrogenase/sirohydrochlorin ferrochelatase [Candidatus Omnitrophica bacterium]|nr:bifunctional precorrin-2 dehydrogenase/sirohydrochlorin ferrochelatase [Candidatus Omnitrophota bacterium]